MILFELGGEWWTPIVETPRLSSDKGANVAAFSDGGNECRLSAMSLASVEVVNSRRERGMAYGPKTRPIKQGGNRITWNVAFPVVDAVRTVRHAVGTHSRWRAGVTEPRRKDSSRVLSPTQRFGMTGLRRVAVVVAKHAAEALARTHRTRVPRHPPIGLDDPVVEALVVPLGVVVSDELANRVL